jgi:hypothetical protein
VVVELLFVVLLLLGVSKLVAFSLMDERSIADAICFDVIIDKDATKINESTNAVKTIFLFIFIQSFIYIIVFNPFKQKYSRNFRIQFDIFIYPFSSKQHYICHMVSINSLYL